MKNTMDEGRGKVDGKTPKDDGRGTRDEKKTNKKKGGRFAVDVIEPNQTRQTLWDTIISLKEFTAADLLEPNLDVTTINDYLRGLVAAGYLERTGNGNRKTENGERKAGIVDRDEARQGLLPRTAYRTRYTYRVLKAPAEPPRVRTDGTEITAGRGRQQMWNTIRARRIFTVADLRALSSTQEHPVAESSVEKYIQYLQKAGYIKNMDGRTRDRATYRLIKNTGPKAPMIQVVRSLWDPNLKAVVWPPSMGDGQGKMKSRHPGERRDPEGSGRRSGKA